MMHLALVKERAKEKGNVRVHLFPKNYEASGSSLQMVSQFASDSIASRDAIPKASLERSVPKDGMFVRSRGVRRTTV